MYSSLKDWVNLPLVIKPFMGYTGTGSKKFGELIDTQCYAEGKVQVIKDDKGVEVVSNKQLYVDGNTSIKALDSILFEEEEKAVIAVGTYYRGGKPDLKVVYL